MNDSFVGVKPAANCLYFKCRVLMSFLVGLRYGYLMKLHNLNYKLSFPAEQGADQGSEVEERLLE